MFTLSSTACKHILIVKAVPLSVQRSLASNFDQRLREPQECGKFRHEACCVCCARRMWSEDLSLLILFQDPVLPEAEYYREPDVQSLHGSQQERLCDLLGVERYLQRWPQLAECPRVKRELQASAVQHPYLQDRYLLLHKKAMPEDTKSAAKVCRSCRSSLTSSTLALPRFALANDLWMGRPLPELRNLSTGTRRLLPLVRACLQVTVLQPTNLSAQERQKGFIGNSIFLPQARPSKVLSTLPPAAADMAETILFVLAGGKKQQFRRSGVLEAPRQEYVNAVRTLQEVSMYYSDVPLSEECSNTEDLWQQCVLETDEDSYLARELLQKGPAESQGQQEGEPEIDEAEKAHEESGALPKKNLFKFLAFKGFSHRCLCILRRPFCAGHLLTSLVGLNDGADEDLRWLRLAKDMEHVCLTKKRGSMSDPQLVLHNRNNNTVGEDPNLEAGNLLGTEAQHERRVLRQIRDIQAVARQGVDQERRSQAQMFGVHPQQLVVPSEDRPLSLFEPATWSMAFPDLFPFGDGVPFLKREVHIEAGEVFRYLLMRDELDYSVEGESVAAPARGTAVPRWRTAVSSLQRSGYPSTGCLSNEGKDVYIMRSKRNSLF